VSSLLHMASTFPAPAVVFRRAERFCVTGRVHPGFYRPHVAAPTCGGASNTAPLPCRFTRRPLSFRKCPDGVDRLSRCSRPAVLPTAGTPQPVSENRRCRSFACRCTTHRAQEARPPRWRGRRATHDQARFAQCFAPCLPRCDTAEVVAYPTRPHRRRIVDQAIRQRRAEATAIHGAARRPMRRARACGAVDNPACHLRRLFQRGHIAQHAPACKRMFRV
jgi:hypothetical protein